MISFLDSSPEPAIALMSQSYDDEISLTSISDGDSIEVKEDIQEDYIIYEREITPNKNAKYKNIVVTTDNNSNRIWFYMYHTFDDIDMCTKEVKIIWINAEEQQDMCEACDISCNDTALRFAWNIPLSATIKAGTVTFAIRITDITTGYVWNTLPYTIEVVEGLYTEDWDSFKQENPSWVQYIEQKYGDGGSGGGGSTPSSDKIIVDTETIGSVDLVVNASSHTEYRYINCTANSIRLNITVPTGTTEIPVDYKTSIVVKTTNSTTLTELLSVYFNNDPVYLNIVDDTNIEAGSILNLVFWWDSFVINCTYCSCNYS